MMKYNNYKSIKDMMKYLHNDCAQHSIIIHSIAEINENY